MNTQHCILLALSALSPTTQKVAATGAPAAQAPASKAVDAQSAGFESLVVLTLPLPGPSSQAGSLTAVYPAMRELASHGDGRALAWCARNLDPRRPGADLDAALLMGTLVRDHAQAPWLSESQFDPLAAIGRAGPATRAAIEATLAGEVFGTDASSELALFARAALLAPRHAGELHARQRALDLLEELRLRAPQGRFAARAADLQWRIEHLTPGLAAPSLEVFDVDGNQVMLSDWLGQDVLVDVWRDDDPDLRAHLEGLRQLVRRIAKLQPERRLQVIGIGLGSEASRFRRELEELDLDWTTSFESEFRGQAGAAWRLDGLANTCWVDPAGALRAVGTTLAELELLLLAPVVEVTRSGSSEPLRSLPAEEQRAGQVQGDRR